ncbi:leucine-rich repeat-containing protein [Tanacetum coccineum]|uniref:Leucine-rich repeat-containing protein n=1 Tax=Tanacetum coccineum TaxID=301880 RepID=A0ABQ5BDV1_9ASTR
MIVVGGVESAATTKQVMSTQRSLIGRGLGGEISLSLLNLTYLTEVDLIGNSFHGTISKFISSMTHLTFLRLSNNKFTGTIPESICNMTQLIDLDLSGNKFSGTIPISIGSLTSLTYLDLSENKFSGVQFFFFPDPIWLLTKRTYLNLQDNSFYGTIPRKFGNLTNLEYLGLGSLRSCTVENLDWLSSLSSLKELEMDGTSLAKANNWVNVIIGQQNLFLLSLDGCDLSRVMHPYSSSVNSSSSIKYLFLEKNNLNSPMYGNLSDFLNTLSTSATTLQTLDASSNQFTGSLSDEIQNFSFLKRLNLSSNQLNGTISDKLWQLPNLQTLHLSFNNISGKLPKSLSNHDLDLLDLSSNFFYGPIPAFPAGIGFVDLSRNKFHGGHSFLCQPYGNLEYLDLSRNTITGQLPDCFQNLTNLEVLNVGHNMLSGRIPPSIGYLGQLETLYLYNNSFSGELPLNLKNCAKLRLLDLGANILYGTIPYGLKKHSRLYALNLKSNNLFGTIPSQICQLESLQILDLSFNNLHGTIPPCVNSLTSMVQKGLFYEYNIHHYLSIINNTGKLDGVDNSYIDHLLIEWQGKVNEFSSILEFLKVIDLSSNNLTGQIPNEVTNLHGLLVLDLSNNSLVGEIPRNIGHMTELLTLNLSRNMFSGEMPSSMSDMHSLNDLDLSFNNLSGRVPSSTQLQSFPPEWFTGNVGLCGLPTTTKCLEDEDQGVPPISDYGDAESTGELQRWFYIGGATGFATAFWIACSALLLNRRLRHTFLHFHDCLKDRKGVQ